MRKQIRLTVTVPDHTSTAALSAVRDALAATAREWLPNAEIIAEAEILPDPAPSDLAAYASGSVPDAEWNAYLAAVRAAEGGTK